MDAAADIRSVHPADGGWDSFIEEALYLAAGAVFTLGLFAAMARFEGVDRRAQAPDIQDLRSVSALYEPPPPAVQEQPQERSDALPLTGLEIGVSGSAVKVSVVPPDLTSIIPTTEIPPRANVQFDQLYSDLKPRGGMSGGVERVYKPSEVDKAPAAIVKTIAHVSRRAREDADELRTRLELVIDAKGEIASIRVLKSSGNKEFDAIVLRCVHREWIFSPAIKNGKNVKCLVDQLIWYKWTAGSPFKI
jgi:TonB family protein